MKIIIKYIKKLTVYKKYGNIRENEIVFDAYSGIGTIGLIAATKGAKHVTAVENVKEAVEDAIYNAKSNGISNYEAVCGDATEFLIDAAKEHKNIDLLFMDPPRKGSTPEFIEAVKKISPSRIVYVSCNPSTLARDCAQFVDKYNIMSIQPVDLFPHTSHVECITLLSRKEDKNTKK